MTSGKKELNKLILQIIALAALYILFGYIGLSLVAPPQYATVIWPSAGIALGALLICGRKLWIGVALGAIIFNLSHLLVDAKNDDIGLLIFSAFCITTGATLQAFAGAQLINKYVGSPRHLKSINQTLLLFFLGGPISCMISATTGTSILWLNDYFVRGDILANWLIWWTGDVFGVFVFLPLVLMIPLNEGERIFRTPFNKNVPGLVIFATILPLGLTFYAWKISSEYIYEKNKAYFSVMAREAQLSLMNRLDAYKQNLASSSSYLMEKDHIDRDQWKIYVESLKLSQYNPGINGLGVILDIPVSKMDKFLTFQKEEMPNFTVHPEGHNAENYIITYIEPVEKNFPAIGYNIASEERRYHAAQNARDTGNTVLTKKLTLVQDNSRGAGFLILHPIYNKPLTHLQSIQDRRAHFKGWIYAPFIGKNFMESLSLLQSHMVDVKAYDGLSVEPDGLIFNTLDHNKDHADHSPLYTIEMPIHILEQNWTLVWLSTHEFEESVDSNEPNIILVSGLIVSFLLGWILLTLSKRTENIEVVVAEKTKELSASEEKFRDAMEFASIGKALVDLDGRFMKVNQALCDFLGYSEEELMSLDFQKLTHPDDIAEDLHSINALLNGENKAYQIEKRYIHKLGNILWAILNVSLVRDTKGRPKYFVSEINDITQKRELDRIKDEFISITSHELKTPITSINLALNLLSKSLPSGLPEEITKFVDMASRNSRRLILLINDILDLKKISAGMMEYQISVENLSALLKEAIEENANYGAKYGVTFVLKPLSSDVFIKVDPKRLVQVISNLLSNAAKFSHHDGVVEISLLRNNGRIRVSFKDNGIGIPLDFHNRIFQKFSQADSSMTRKEEGTGLGLFICKEMIEKMNGNIGFTSIEGPGSIFWFEFDEFES